MTPLSRSEAFSCFNCDGGIVDWRSWCVEWVFNDAAKRSGKIWVHRLGRSTILPTTSPHLQHSPTMAPFSGDGVLWLCLGKRALDALGRFDLTETGISLFFAVRGIATDLRQVIDLTEIKHAEREDKIISEGTEDGTSNMAFLSYSFLTMRQCLS